MKDVFSPEQEERIREIVAGSRKPSFWQSWCVDAFMEWSDWDSSAFLTGGPRFLPHVRCWAAFVHEKDSLCPRAFAVVVEPLQQHERFRLALSGELVAGFDGRDLLKGFPGAFKRTFWDDAPPSAFVEAIGDIDENLLEVDSGNARHAWALERYLIWNESWPQKAPAPRAVGVAVAGALSMARATKACGPVTGEASLD